MGRWLSVGLLLAVLGCAPGWYASPPPGSTGPLQPNPVLVPPCQPEAIWENVVDVVDDYFPIEREEPVRQVEGVITEGHLYTFPEIGATVLEPWRHDSATVYERVESTLQSVRRRAVVRVRPTERGYEVGVVVFKELEDLPQPAQSRAGSATFRYDDSLSGVENPVTDVPVEPGWIPQGRDLALEQRMLGQILSRVGTAAWR
ncbi:MAG: hypothetical protein JW809_04305 [Pirellulales bacterium]|nr:hypothetical protein [Pirellulales bacterium]